MNYQKNFNQRGNKRNQNRRNNADKKEVNDVDENNPIIAIFKQCSKELVDKQDRYERIVKYGRDITIESKRIIFLLHTVDFKKSNNDQILKEAFNRLLALCETHFASIAKELHGLDPYQYARAFSPGLQEFTEAFTYYEYVSNGKIFGWDDLQEKMTYEELVPIQCQEEDIENVMEDDTDQITDKKQKKIFKCLVQPMEFMLGLADLSGEVMRRCITSLGSGDVETCFQACSFLQSLYAGYMGLSQVRQKDMNNKIYALRQSVLKVENVCYNVTVRGGEAAKWGTLDSVDNKTDEIDEGFY